MSQPNVGKVVGGHPVGLDKDLVVHLAVVHLDVAVHHIVKAGHALTGDLLADDVRLACGKALFHFLLGQLSAAAVVVGHLTGSALLGVQSLQALLGAEAVIGFALCHQLLGILLEHAHALALHIGAHRAADIRALVPQKAGLPQGVVDDIHSALHIAALIGVLDAQDEGAILVLGHQVGVQGSTQVANVHITRGRGCKTGHWLCKIVRIMEMNDSLFMCIPDFLRQQESSVRTLLLGIEKRSFILMQKICG